MREIKTKDYIRFEKKFYVTPGCWIWTASTRSGYGSFKFGRIFQMTASRASYFLYVGPVPDGIFVCHRCDNPLCVNPDHLFLGTALDNAQDKIRKGRHHVINGEDHVLSKLNDQAVIEIRKSNELHKILAIRYGVTKSTISKVKIRETWRHIP